MSFATRKDESDDTQNIRKPVTRGEPAFRKHDLRILGGGRPNVSSPKSDLYAGQAHDQWLNALFGSL